MCWYKNYLASQMFWDTVGWHWTSLWHGWTDMDALYLSIYNCRLRPSNVKHSTCNTPQHPSTSRSWLWRTYFFFFSPGTHSFIPAGKCYDRVEVPRLPTCTHQARPPLKMCNAKPFNKLGLLINKSNFSDSNKTEIYFKLQTVYFLSEHLYSYIQYTHTDVRHFTLLLEG